MVHGEQCACAIQGGTCNHPCCPSLAFIELQHATTRTMQRMHISTYVTIPRKYGQCHRAGAECINTHVPGRKDAANYYTWRQQKSPSYEYNKREILRTSTAAVLRSQLMLTIKVSVRSYSRTHLPVQSTHTWLTAVCQLCRWRPLSVDIWSIYRHRRRRTCIQQRRDFKIYYIVP